MTSQALCVDYEKVSDDLWLLSRNNMTIAFSPLSRLAFEVYPQGIDAIHSHFRGNLNPLIEKFLSENGFYIKFKIEHKSENEQFSPKGVVLSLTSGCNLNCIYCYADAGTKNVTMKEGIGRMAIDYAMKNSQELLRSKSRVFFHGGGEAMVVWPLMKKLTEYAADKYKTMVRFSAVTNATLITPKRADWLAHHKFRLTVSLDGPQIVQDYQRPTRNTLSSFDLCYSGLRLLYDRQINFGIRATVTSVSSEYVEDLVRIASDFKCGLKLEPFTAVGRGQECDEQLGITPYQFAKTFLRAENLGRRLGVNVVTSSLRVDTPGENFCAGNGSMFLVTPTGDISSCSRTTQVDDVTSNTFFIGKIQNNEVYIDVKRVIELRKLIPDNFEECNDCFAKYYCRGGCHNTRVSFDGKPNESHCILARWFLWLTLYRGIFSLLSDGVMY
ncbi:radical SAM protein [Candidatus Woesearchaeota archaeon]|nr:radical SAM protein [Candidatus Woesearchaeota archaeon]